MLNSETSDSCESSAAEEEAAKIYDNDINFTRSRDMQQIRKSLALKIQRYEGKSLSKKDFRILQGVLLKSFGRHDAYQSDISQIDKSGSQDTYS